MDYEQINTNYEYCKSVWQPSLVLVDSGVKDNPETLKILGRCDRAAVQIVQSKNGRSDDDLLREVTGEKSKEKLGHLARKSLLLFGCSDISQQMASGPVNERRCYNFTKITPYIGVCRASCGYCWFKDAVLIPKVNVQFFEFLPDLIAKYRTKQLNSVVFTFTHYKTDCFSIEHLTGFARKIATIFECNDGFYVQFLTKLHTVDALLKRPPSRGTIVAFSVNAPHVTRSVELGASPLIRRLDAGRRLSEAGIPVILRIDPVWAIGDWKRGYNELTHLISERFVPNQITVGTPRFQSLDELHRVIGAIKEPKTRIILEHEASKMTVSKPGCPDENGQPHYFKNLSVSYTYEIRRSLYKHIVDSLSQALPTVSIGLCEEPQEMWEACGLSWTCDPAIDCSCNYIPNPITRSLRSSKCKA